MKIWLFSQPLVYCILLLFSSFLFFLNHSLSFSLPSSTCFVLVFIFHLEAYFGLYVCAAEVGVIIFCWKEAWLQDLRKYEDGWLKKSHLCSLMFGQQSSPKAVWGKRWPVRLLLIRELICLLIHLKFPSFLSSFLTQNWINCLLCA